MIPSPVCSVAAWITLSFGTLDCAFCGTAKLVLLEAACGLCVLADPRCSCFQWPRAEYVPCRSAAEDIARLRSAQLLAVSGLCAFLVRESSPLFIFSNFHPSMRGVDTCLNLGVFGFSSRGSIYIVTSVLTQRELDHHCSVFNILVDLRPEFPDRDAVIKDSSEGKIGMYIRFIEFANFQIPLSKFLLCVIEYYQNNISQLFVIGAAKISHFEIMCRALGRVPAVGTFRRLYDELNVNAGKMKKRVAFVSGSPHVKKARTEGVIISDSWPSTAGKSPTASRRLIRQSGQANTSSVSAAPATKDDSSSSVTPTPEHASGDDNLRTRPPSSRFVVLSSSSTDTDIPTSPQVIPPVSSAQASVSVPVTEPVSDGRTSSVHELEAETFSATPSQGSNANDLYESQTIDSAIALNVYVPNWNITINARIDNPVTCRNLLDHVTPPDCDGLRSRVVGKDKVREEFVLQQDAVKRRFVERDVDLDSRIADVRRGMDNDLYPHMLTTIAGRWWVIGHGFRLAVHQYACSVECRSTLGKVISMAINKGIQQGLEAGIVHGKVGRSLTQIEAYDPEVEGKYVAAVSAFENVSFPLLDELEGLKDSPLALIMPSLILKDNHGVADTTPEFSRFQPSLGQRGLCPPPSSKLGGASSSAPPHDSSFGVTYYQLSTLVLSDDRGSATQPPAVQAHNDLFDTSVLDGPGAIPLVDGTWRAINGYDQLLEEQSRMEGQD
nr:transposase (putative), gypsy type [Tanacetum cinerariifolium]